MISYDGEIEYRPLDGYDGVMDMICVYSQIHIHSHKTSPKPSQLYTDFLPVQIHDDIQFRP